MSNWVVIYKSTNINNSNIVKSVLEDNAINVVIVDKMDSMHTHLMNAEIQLHVSPENVIRATNVANKMNVNTLAICGYDGGQLKQISNNYVWIRSFDMQICEDAQTVFGHMVMKDLCAMPGHSNLESPTKSDVQGLAKMKRLAVIGNYLWPLKRPML